MTDKALGNRSARHAAVQMPAVADLLEWIRKQGANRLRSGAAKLPIVAKTGSTVHALQGNMNRATGAATGRRSCQRRVLPNGKLWAIALPGNFGSAELGTLSTGQLRCSTAIAHHSRHKSLRVHPRINGPSLRQGRVCQRGPKSCARVVRAGEVERPAVRFGLPARPASGMRMDYSLATSRDPASK